MHEQHVGAVVAAGAIEACVAVLQTGPDDAKANAAWTLANIADEEQHAGAVVAAGAIEACVALLQTGPDDAKATAAGTLANISYHEQHLENLVAAGVITTALDMMMHSMDSEVKLYATLILAHCFRSFGCGGDC